MSNKYDAIRRIFETVDNKIDNRRWIATGIVKEVRPSDRKIRVAILPDLNLTNWVRVYYLNAGENYMSGPLPEKDSEVVCFFLGGSQNAAFVLAGGFVHNDDTPPELESDYAFPIYDKYGNSVVLSSGGITITSSKDISINVEGNTNIKTTGNTVVESTGTCDVKGSTIKLNGGTKPVARVGDEVATPTGIGKIIGPGNTSVLA